MSLQTESVGAVLVLGAGGLILGPNLGHWYRGTAFTRGTGLRVVALAAAAYGFVRSALCDDGCSDRAPYIMLGGALLYVGATVDDILTAPARVREHNQRLEVIGVTPMVTDRAAGFGLVGRF